MLLEDQHLTYLTITELVKLGEFTHLALEEHLLLHQQLNHLEHWLLQDLVEVELQHTLVYVVAQVVEDKQLQMTLQVWV